jgi:hypothetical protein
MKMFRHACLNGEIWDQLIQWEKPQANEIPKTCPNKVDCGRGWEEVDLSMYKRPPFAFLEHIKEKPNEH